VTEPVDPEIARQVALIAGGAELRAIAARELNWRLEELAAPIENPVNLEMSLNLGHGRVADRVRYQLHSQVKGTNAQGVIFTFEARHDAYFDLPPDSEVTDAALMAFGQTSVLLILFPYLRESVQSRSVESGIPPVILAPIRHGIPEPDSAEMPEAPG
jgi:preprotein translocase subunit SecB